MTNKITPALSKFFKEVVTLEEMGEDVLRYFFMASSLIIAPIPHKKPDEGEIKYKQKQGNLELCLVADPDIGLPYGEYSRLLLAWLTTAAIQQKSRELSFDHITQFAKQFNILPTGGEKGTLTALRNHAMRVFTTSIHYRYEGEEAQWYLFQGINFFPIEEHKLWLKRQLSEDGKVIPFEPNDARLSVTLSEQFYQLITTHAVPFKLDILILLRPSTLAMDLYLWLSYRYQALTKPITIGWRSLKRQFGPQYKNDRFGFGNFKKCLMNALKKINAAYVEANFIIDSKKGLTLLPSRSSVAARQQGEKQ